VQDSLPSHGSPTPFSSGYGFVVLAFRPPFGAHESPNDVYNKGELLKRRGICFLLAAILRLRAAQAHELFNSIFTFKILEGTHMVHFYPLSFSTNSTPSR